MKRIALDLDGVCLDFSRHFIEYLKLPNHPIDSYDDPRFDDHFHLIDEDHEFWGTVPRIFDPSLLRFKPIAYVTARNISTQTTEYSLWRSGFPEAPVVSVGRGGSKVAALKDKADIYLDDHVDNFLELNSAGINTYLITARHNLYFDAGKKRVESVLEFQNKILKI